MGGVRSSPRGRVPDIRRYFGYPGGDCEVSRPTGEKFGVQKSTEGPFLHAKFRPIGA